MTNEIATTYEEWIKREQELGESGLKCLIADKLVKRLNERGYKSMAKTMVNAVIKHIRENGFRPHNFLIATDFDVGYRAHELDILLESVNGDHPLEWLDMAYQAWQIEQARRIDWETKSLWQYIKGWLRRKFR